MLIHTRKGLNITLGNLMLLYLRIAEEGLIWDTKR